MGKLYSELPLTGRDALNEVKIRLYQCSLKIFHVTVSSETLAIVEIECRANISLECKLSAPVVQLYFKHIVNLKLLS